MRLTRCCITCREPMFEYIDGQWWPVNDMPVGADHVCEPEPVHDAEYLGF